VDLEPFKGRTKGLWAQSRVPPIGAHTWPNSILYNVPGSSSRKRGNGERKLVGDKTSAVYLRHIDE